MKDLKIGDYYNLEQIENKILIKESENGYEDQYFHKEDIRFKILDIKENGDILLISEKPTEQKITLKGKVGYKNGIEILDKLAREITGIENARSINFEDILDSKYWEDEEKKKLIWGEDNDFYYWLAPECVHASNYHAYWGLRDVDSGDVYDDDLYYSYGGEYSGDYGVRPVVCLKSKIQEKKVEG